MISIAARAGWPEIALIAAKHTAKGSTAAALTSIRSHGSRASIAISVSKIRYATQAPRVRGFSVAMQTRITSAATILAAA